jgi:RNA polymerase sigma factor (sigma-70 family)
MHRSPLTVLHTLRRHDQQVPDRAILPLAAVEMSEAEREKLHKTFRRGVELGALAKRLRRPRTAIYAALLEERMNKLGRRKMRFIDDDLYHGEDAPAAVNAIAGSGQEELADARSGGVAIAEASRLPRDLPPYLQALYRTPLLSPARERALFLKFNFHKFQFVSLRRKLDPQFARHRDLVLLESCLRQATETKNAIVRANLRLVVSIARKHLRPGLSLMELVSDGNLTLMRAVDSFDIHRGNRFSTYATLALMKGFARSVGQMINTHGPAPTDLAGRALGRRTTRTDVRLLAGLPDARLDMAHDRLLARDHVRQLLGRLDPRERSVVLAYYGLEGEPTATYQQVAHRLGLSKQRVRQIEQSALAKLRAGADGR